MGKKKKKTPSVLVTTTLNQTAQTTQIPQTPASHSSNSSSSSTSAPLNTAFQNLAISTPTVVQNPTAKIMGGPVKELTENGVARYINPAVTRLLRLIVEGEQDHAEAMIKAEPALLLQHGDVTDLSGRKFENITAFQYALWALDWHMWTMLQRYLPDEAAYQQIKAAELGSWVSQYGTDARQLIQNLATALRTCVDLYRQHKFNEGDKVWVEQVGGAQLLLPVHVVNTYCDPTRSFDPCPNFTEAVVLPRSRQTDEGEWFSCKYSGGGLGVEWAGQRGSWPLLQPWSQPACGLNKRMAVYYHVPQGVILDEAAIRSLVSARTSQHDKLITGLTNKNILSIRSIAQTANSTSSNNNVNTSSNNASKTTILSTPLAAQFNLSSSSSSSSSSEVLAAVPKVNPVDVAKFLKLVAEGEQNEAEKMLIANKELALASGDVTDLSKREFKNITAFQYAAWALDWHMWTMILKYLPPAEQKVQAEQFETGSWVKTHGVTATQLIQNLVNALNELSCNGSRWNDEKIYAYWIKQVGGAQFYLPAHVVNEYCRLDMGFYPSEPFDRPRDFLESTLPRSRQIQEFKWSGSNNQLEWFGEGQLGQKLAVARCGIIRGAINVDCTDADRREEDRYAQQDCDAMRELLNVRTSQRTRLIASIKNASTNTNALKY